jgi:PHD/YefM family antitoxin component YafN of YafNO toxin-antitoxin module
VWSTSGRLPSPPAATGLPGERLVDDRHRHGIRTVRRREEAARAQRRAECPEELLIAPAPSCNHHIQCELDEDTMLDLANDIRSLSEFKRNTVDLLDRLRKTGHPLVLTINGKAELVVQDAAAYQALLDRVEAIEGIRQGLADVKAGRTRPARQVFARQRRKHGMPR